MWFYSRQVGLTNKHGSKILSWVRDLRFPQSRLCSQPHKVLKMLVYDVVGVLDGGSFTHNFKSFIGLQYNNEIILIIKYKYNKNYQVSYVRVVVACANYLFLYFTSSSYILESLLFPSLK